jgi:hypothetical protein
VLKSELSVLEEYQNPKDTSKPVQYDDSKKSFARKKPSERLVQTSSKSKMVLNKFHMREFKEKDTSENGLN